MHWYDGVREHLPRQAHNGDVPVNADWSATLDLAQGPLFRFAFALMVLGFLRLALIGISEAVTARLLSADTQAFRSKLNQRLLWFIVPHIVLRQATGKSERPLYHWALSFFSFIFRMGAVIVPAFMVAHVYLWERGLGISWPSLPPRIGDQISLMTILAGVIVFFGRLYSPLLRRTEPAWSFITPLILISPFVTGVLAVHPTWSPVSYQVIMLLHVLSACLVFVLLPFARLLSFMHCPITRWVPAAAWRNVPLNTPEEAASKVVRI